jgi:hypothetical protein
VRFDYTCFSDKTCNVKKLYEVKIPKFYYSKLSFDLEKDKMYSGALEDQLTISLS